MTTTIEDMYKQIASLNKMFPLDFKHGIELIYSLDEIRNYIEDVKKYPPRYFELRSQFKQVIMKELERVGEIEEQYLHPDSILELQKMLEDSETEKCLAKTRTSPSFSPPSGPPPPPLENVPPVVHPTNGLHNLTTNLPIATSCIEGARKIAESRSVSDVKETGREVKKAYNKIMENPKQNNIENGKKEI